MLFNDSELTQPSYLIIQSVINTAYAWVRDPCVTAPQSVLFIYLLLPEPVKVQVRKQT